MTPRSFGFVLLCATLYTGALGRSDLRNSLSQYEAAHNNAFHEDLLKQLSAAKASNIVSSALAESTAVRNGSLVFEKGPETLVATDTNSLQIYTTDSLPTDPAPPSACAAALTASIACNSTIPLMAISPTLFNDELSTVCTTGCTAGLKSYRAAVVSACGKYMIPDAGNVTIAPTLAVDYVQGPYSVQCLQDPVTLAYCGPLLQSYNASAGLSSLPTNQLCSYCVLETLNVTLSNPTTYSVAIAGILSSSIAKCGSKFNAYNVSSAPAGNQVVLDPGVSGFGTNSTAAPAADCSIVGRNVTTGVATTCAALAQKYSVSEFSVLASNPSLASCDSISAGKILCLPQACTTYTIATNDTCDSVAALAQSKAGTTVTTTQLQSFNPDLGTYCQLMALRVGKQICLSPNGGFPQLGATTGAQPSATPTAVAAVPSPTASGTTSACGKWYQIQSGDYCKTIALNNGVALTDFLTLNPVPSSSSPDVNANCTNLWLDYYYCVAPYPPFATVTASPIITANYSSATIISYTIPTANYTPTTYTVALTTAGVAAPTNVAGGTLTVGCGNYYTIQHGDTLNSVTKLVGVNSTELQTWNPELSSGTLPAAGSAICVVFPMGNYTLYPATPPANAYVNATAKCAQYYTVKQGDGCSSIATSFGLTTLQLSTLNPGLKTDCSNLILGIAYCVFPIYPISSIGAGSSIPVNVAPGTITVGCLEYYTVVSGDNCGAIETKYGLTSTQFLTYNPEIVPNCSNLQLGVAYCVKFNTTTTSGGTSTNGGPPTNLASGSLTNCTLYYSVASGDNCATIETKHSIAATDFFRWNPEVNPGCNILAGEAYCVRGGGNPCGKIYTVQSGDYCYAITQSQGITQDQLAALNPWLDSGCSLNIGQVTSIEDASSIRQVKPVPRVKLKLS
ncbi:hypothetical protein H0H93_009429 [Arthromyces matolae]|nr:hypothetical protein H0H93_009429 [Arthromyces matolae]